MVGKPDFMLDLINLKMQIYSTEALNTKEEQQIVTSEELKSGIFDGEPKLQSSDEWLWFVERSAR